ncbi:hypothetical protein G6F22_020508 [Rhizopus arrhizus]|nr:hypothetical protein G6F22_020508 [Rhizopus arrhizus]
MLEIQAEGDIAFQRQPRQEAGVLERHGHAGVHARQGRAFHQQRPSGRRLQPGQHAQQAGLARPAGAQHGDHFAACQIQVHVMEHRSRRAGIAQRQAARLQYRRRAARHAAASAASLA